MDFYELLELQCEDPHQVCSRPLVRFVAAVEYSAAHNKRCGRESYNLLRLCVSCGSRLENVFGLKRNVPDVRIFEYIMN